MPVTRQKVSVTFVVMPMPSGGDSNAPVSIVAAVIVASGGVSFARSVQLSASAGAAISAGAVASAARIARDR